MLKLERNPICYLATVRLRRRSKIATLEQWMTRFFKNYRRPKHLLTLTTTSTVRRAIHSTSFKLTQKRATCQLCLALRPQCSRLRDWSQSHTTSSRANLIITVWKLALEPDHSIYIRAEISNNKLNQRNNQSIEYSVTQAQAVLVLSSK